MITSADLRDPDGHVPPTIFASFKCRGEPNIAAKLPGLALASEFMLLASFARLRVCASAMQPHDGITSNSQESYSADRMRDVCMRDVLIAENLILGKFAPWHLSSAIFVFVLALVF